MHFLLLRLQTIGDPIGPIMTFHLSGGDTWLDMWLGWIWLVSGVACFLTL